MSETVLVFVSEGYFVSPNCLRELLRAVFDKKPIVTVIEVEAKHGALATEEVRAQLDAAEASYARWGLVDDMATWSSKPPPSATVLSPHRSW